MSPNQREREEVQAVRSVLCWLWVAFTLGGIVTLGWGMLP